MTDAAPPRGASWFTLPAVRYEVQDMSSSNAQGRFEHEQDEELGVGETFSTFTMTYRVLNVIPDHGDFDALVQVERIAGPGQIVPN